MPAITWEPYGEGGKYVIYESPQVGPYKTLALVAALFAAVMVGVLASSTNRCPSI